MKTITSVALLLLAGAAHAQTPAGQTPPPASASPSHDLTGDLNSGPPAPAVYLAPAPATTTGPAPTVSTVPAPIPTPTPRASAPAAPSVAASPPRIAPIPAAPAPQPRTAPITPPATAATAAPRAEPLAGTSGPAAGPVPAAEPAASPPSPAAPAVTVLDSAARAALPFSADLPPGFEIVTGRPGPDFRIYTIRRAGQSFVMIYAGPASQFPIYTGQMVEAGGRASIVATEDGERHAIEHLFQRPTAPLEVHVWTMSLDGADRAMAEQIAQSIDVR